MKARNEKEKEGKSLLNIYLDIFTKSIMTCKNKTKPCHCNLRQQACIYIKGV